MLGLTLVLGLVGIGIQTTYAQEKSNACPDGFTLNKGVCQAEPTIVTIPGGCPSDINGIPVVQVAANECNSAALVMSQELIDACNSVNGFLFSVNIELFRCAFPPSEDETTITCDVGTLNELTELCEVKPGNRNGQQ
jgi:hypothetical protein